MAIKAFLNVSLESRENIKTIADEIKKLSHVDNVTIVSKVVNTDLVPHDLVDLTQNIDADLVIHISGKSFQQVVGVVLDIGNLSHPIKSMVTSFALNPSKSWKSKSGGRQ